jgi:hypothetical protein
MNEDSVQSKFDFNRGIYFSGATYQAEHDRDRLLRQMERVRACMKDGEWRTLYEIQAVTGDSVQSISARLRDFRKQRFGSHTVNRRRRGLERRGLFEYQLILYVQEPAEDRFVEAKP